MAMGENMHEQSWTGALCKVINTSNADDHLRSQHPDSDEVTEYFAHKRSRMRGALQSGNGK